jgi:hypothetical protein
MEDYDEQDKKDLAAGKVTEKELSEKHKKAKKEGKKLVEEKPKEPEKPDPKK